MYKNERKKEADLVKSVLILKNPEKLFVIYVERS